MRLFRYVYRFITKVPCVRDFDQRERAYALAKTIDDIRMRYGKNSVLRASSHLPYSPARYRNGLMGGHKALGGKRDGT